MFVCMFICLFFGGDLVLLTEFIKCKLATIKKIQSNLYKPFNSHEWPRQNFSLQYQYNINQISDENKEKHQFGDN